MDAILWKDLLSLRRNKKTILLFFIASIIILLCIMYGFASLKQGSLPMISYFYGAFLILGLVQEPSSLQDGSFEALLATHLSLKKITFKRVMLSSLAGLLLALMTAGISWAILQIIGYEIKILWREVALSIILSLLITISATGIPRAEFFTIARNRFLMWLIPLSWQAVMLLLFLSFFFENILPVVWALSVIYLVFFSLLFLFGRVDKEAIILWRSSSK